ncbi:MAG: hypothetical protein ABI662_12005 [Dermatophilaceae bacterium]
MNRIDAGAAVCSALLFVSACGGGTSATSGATSAPATAASGGGSNSADGARAFPGATGLLAAIEGTTLQVQSADVQTAVTYSPATAFTSTVAAQRTSVVVGDCVQARSARLVAGPGGSAPTVAPGAATGPILAASVEVSPAVNGTCSVFTGLRTPGGRPPGTTGDPGQPGGAPAPSRTGGPGADGNRFGGNGFGALAAFGKVTAVNAASFTLDSQRPQGGSTAAVPTTRIVRTSATTTYTRTAAATAKALVVGLCVTAFGKASDTGSIAATSISLRPAQNGSCSSGFGRRPGGAPTSPGGAAGA